MADAVGGEEYLGPGEEGRTSGAFSVEWMLGVSQSGGPVDRGVQVDVPRLRTNGLGPVDHAVRATGGAEELSLAKCEASLLSRS